MLSIALDNDVVNILQRVFFKESYTHICRIGTVPARAEERAGGRQHPQLPFLENYDPEAVLAMVPAAR